MTYPLVDDGEALTRPYGLIGVPETFVDRPPRPRRRLPSRAGSTSATSSSDRYDEHVERALGT